MEICTFSLWKFKVIEGQIECNGNDYNSTIIKKGFNTYKLTYDLVNETCSLNNVYKPEEHYECKFCEIVELLKKLDLWQPMKEKHVSADVNRDDYLKLSKR